MAELLELPPPPAHRVSGAPPASPDFCLVGCSAVGRASENLQSSRVFLSSSLRLNGISSLSSGVSSGRPDGFQSDSVAWVCSASLTSGVKGKGYSFLSISSPFFPHS